MLSFIVGTRDENQGWQTAAKAWPFQGDRVKFINQSRLS